MLIKTMGYTQDGLLPRRIHEDLEDTKVMEIGPFLARDHGSYIDTTPGAPKTARFP